MPIILLLVTLLTTTACSNSVKERIGIVTPQPNEYQVQRSKSLDVPPDYNLPQPATKARRESVPVTSGRLNLLDNAEKALIQDLETNLRIIPGS